MDAACYGYIRVDITVKLGNPVKAHQQFARVTEYEIRNHLECLQVKISLIEAIE